MKKSFNRVLSMVLVVIMLALMTPAGLFTFSAVADDAAVQTVTATVGAGKDYATIGDAINGLKINEDQGKVFELIVYGSFNDAKIDDPTFRNDTVIKAAEGESPVVTIAEAGAKSAWWLTGSAGYNVTFEGISFIFNVSGKNFISPRGAATKNSVITMNDCDIEFNGGTGQWVFEPQNGRVELNDTDVFSKGGVFGVITTGKTGTIIINGGSITRPGSSGSGVFVAGTSSASITNVDVVVRATDCKFDVEVQGVLNQIAGSGTGSDTARTIDAVFTNCEIKYAGQVFVRTRANTADSWVKVVFDGGHIYNPADKQFVLNNGLNSLVDITFDGGVVFDYTVNANSQRAIATNVDCDMNVTFGDCTINAISSITTSNKQAHFLSYARVGELNVNVFDGAVINAVNCEIFNVQKEGVTVNMFGGVLSSEGPFQNVGIYNGVVMNMYGGEINVAGNAGNNFGVNVSNSTFNMYGGTINNTSTNSGSFAVRHNGENGGAYIYGGTLTAEVAAPIGAGTSTAIGNVVIYDGIFVKYGTSGQGVVYHNHNAASTSFKGDKTYYIYGGEFYSNLEAEKKIYANASLPNDASCGGIANRAIELGATVTPIEYTDFAHADLVETPVSAIVDGLDKDTDLLGDAYYQKKNSTYRVLFEIKVDEVENYDNIQFWLSTSVKNPLAPVIDDANVIVTSAEVHNLYKNVIANGETVSASDGYAFAILTIVVQSENVDEIYINAVANGFDGAMTIGDYATIVVG